MLSPFILPDERLISTDKCLFKVIIRAKGLICLSQDILDRELEQIIRVIILHPSKRHLSKLQTTHLLADCRLVSWSLARKLKFSIDDRRLESFPSVIDITIQEKTEEDSQHTSSASVEPSQISKQQGKNLRHGRIAQPHSKRKKTENIPVTHQSRENTSHTDPTRRTESSSVTDPSECNLVLPVSAIHARCPLHGQDPERKQAEITMETEEEDLRLHRLSQPLSQSFIQKDKQAMGQTRRNQNVSLLHQMFDYILTPVRDIIGNKI